MSTLRVGNITATGGTGTITVPTGNQISQTGAVLQVVSTTKTDTFSVASSSMTDVTGLTATITPSATSSKILILVGLQFVGESGVTNAYMGIARGGTAIFAGDAADSRPRASTGTSAGTFGAANSVVFLDQPNTTSATTYSVQVRNQGSGTIYVNRTQSDPNSAVNGGRFASSITVMEIAG